MVKIKCIWAISQQCVEHKVYIYQQFIDNGDVSGITEIFTNEMPAKQIHWRNSMYVIKTLIDLDPNPIVVFLTWDLGVGLVKISSDMFQDQTNHQQNQTQLFSNHDDRAVSIWMKKNQHKWEFKVSYYWMLSQFIGSTNRP